MEKVEIFSSLANIYSENIWRYVVFFGRWLIWYLAFFLLWEYGEMTSFFVFDLIILLWLYMEKCCVFGRWVFYLYMDKCLGASCDWSWCWE
jgi:hypothetical protein